jgi:acetyl-CoA carboxylase biotin carboxyl carrier protein
MASFRATVENMSKLMDEMGITELDLERQLLLGLYRKHIHLSKQQAVAAPVAGFVKPTKTDDKVSGHVLKSPMVGVLYLSPEPGAKPFVKVGSSVKAGDTIALVEAMKTFNPVKSDIDGIVREILVADTAAVEFDTPIAVIEQVSNDAD